MILAAATSNKKQSKSGIAKAVCGKRPHPRRGIGS
jgi:hypothetical protein